MKLKILGAEETATQYSTLMPSLDLKNESVVAVMGGLNDWDGMNNYFNLYGSKLIIVSKDISYKGIINVTLRREDGQNFYGLYPTLRAQLTQYTEEGKP